MAGFDNIGILSSFSWGNTGYAFRWLEYGFDLLLPDGEEEIYPNYTYMVDDFEQEVEQNSYDLEDEPTLFLRFAYLDNEQSYLDFATKYGRLLNDPERPRPVDFNRTRREIDSNGSKFYGEPIGLWEFESIALKNTFELWHYLINKDIDNLNLIIKWITKDNKDFINCALGDVERLKLFRSQSNIDEYGIPNEKGFGDLETYNLPVGFASRVPKGDLFIPAKYLVKERVNLSLENFKVYPALNYDYHDFPGLFGILEPSDLISAIWYQFFEAIVKNKRFKRCMICNQWEDVTTKRSTWTKHPECAARERTARYRAKSK